MQSRAIGELVLSNFVQCAVCHVHRIRQYTMCTHSFITNTWPSSDLIHLPFFLLQWLILLPEHTKSYDFIYLREHRERELHIHITYRFCKFSTYDQLVWFCHTYHTIHSGILQTHCFINSKKLIFNSLSRHKFSTFHHRQNYKNVKYEIRNSFFI